MKRKPRKKKRGKDRFPSANEPVTFQIHRGTDGLYRWKLVTLRRKIIAIMAESSHGFTRRDNAVGAALALHARMSAMRTAPAVEYIEAAPVSVTLDHLSEPALTEPLGM